MPLTIHRGELDHGDVQALLQLHVAAMRRNSPRDACHVLPASSLSDPAITFFSIRKEGQLMAVGALRALDAGQGEIKSMRTAPAALRQGAGTAVLQAIVEEARSRGYKRLLLETGRTGDFAAAITLYEKAGFTPAEPFGGYPASAFTRFFALDL